MINDKTLDQIVWFAISAPHRQELKAQRLFDLHHIECFVPMHYEVVERRGKKRSILTPAIHNLLFVKTSRRILQQLKTGIPYVQYKTRPENGRNVPIIVPDDQMEQFITICKTCDDNLVYLQPEEINLQEGTRVKILGGTFDGVEGVFVATKGHTEKRVVVLIEGLTAVAMAEVSPDLIQVVE